MILVNGLVQAVLVLVPRESVVSDVVGETDVVNADEPILEMVLQGIPPEQQINDYAY